MSRNSKNARLHREAKQASSRRKSGGRGPAKTAKVTKKVKTWFAALKAGKPVRGSAKKEEDGGDTAD